MVYNLGPEIFHHTLHAVVLAHIAHHHLTEAEVVSRIAQAVFEFKQWGFRLVTEHHPGGLVGKELAHQFTAYTSGGTRYHHGFSFYLGMYGGTVKPNGLAAQQVFNPYVFDLRGIKLSTYPLAYRRYVAHLHIVLKCEIYHGSFFPWVNLFNGQYQRIGLARGKQLFSP